MTPKSKFMWDFANVEHIARHNVSPDEAEQVIENEPIDLPVQIRNGEERLAHLGVTDAGRVLVVITVLRDEMVRVVTAHPADRDARKFYAQTKAKQERKADDAKDNRDPDLQE